MTYSKTMTLDTPPDRALNSILTTLTNNGFRIAERGDRSAALSGPGLNSTKQNPLLGASEIGVLVDGDRIRLDAELGGVEKMRRFMTRFPFLLCIGLALVSLMVLGITAAVRGDAFGPNAVFDWRWGLAILAMAMLPALPWVFISPWMSRRLHRQTNEALDALLGNAQHARD